MSFSFKPLELGRRDLPLHGGIGVDGDDGDVVEHVVGEEGLSGAVARVHITKLGVVLL